MSEGNVEIIVGDSSGRIVQRVRSHNLFVASGLDLLRNHISYPDCNSDGFTPQYIALGSLGTAVAPTQTELASEKFRKVITRKVPTAAAQVRFELYVDQTEANDDPHQDIQEAGLFTSAAAGNMWARATFPLIEKTSLLWIVVRWYFTFTAS
jgi:hypothetical protein